MHNGLRGKFALGRVLGQRRRQLPLCPVSYDTEAGGCPTLAFLARVGIRHKRGRSYITAFSPPVNLESLHARPSSPRLRHRISSLLIPRLRSGFRRRAQTPAKSLNLQLLSEASVAGRAAVSRPLPAHPRRNTKPLRNCRCRIGDYARAMERFLRQGGVMAFGGRKDEAPLRHQGDGHSGAHPPTESGDDL